MTDVQATEPATVSYRETPFAGYVQRMPDGLTIPPDPSNADYIEYQAWLAAGGVLELLKPPIGSSQYDWGKTFLEVIGRY